MREAHESVFIQAPVDLVEWIEERRPHVEDVRTTIPILRAILRESHPPWRSDWGPWLREKFYR